MAVLFARQKSDLVKRIGALQKRMDPAAGLWVAWPKRASSVKTDLTEDVVREIALARSLVDNKVCAVDDTGRGSGWCIGSPTGKAQRSPQTWTSTRLECGRARCSQR